MQTAEQPAWSRTRSMPSGRSPPFPSDCSSDSPVHFCDIHRHAVLHPVDADPVVPDCRIFRLPGSSESLLRSHLLFYGWHNNPHLSSGFSSHDIYCVPVPAQIFYLRYGWSPLSAVQVTPQSLPYPSGTMLPVYILRWADRFPWKLPLSAPGSSQCNASADLPLQNLHRYVYRPPVPSHPLPPALFFS